MSADSAEGQMAVRRPPFRRIPQLVLTLLAVGLPAADAGAQLHSHVPPGPPCPPGTPRAWVRPAETGACEEVHGCFEDHFCRIDLDPPLCCGDPRYDREPRTIVDFDCPHDEPHLPDPLAIFFHTLNPARHQFAIDRAFYFDVERHSPAPQGPALHEGMLYDQAGSLGILKYHNEINYTVASLGGDLPTVRNLDLEYAPLDWAVVGLDLGWQEGEDFERITPNAVVTLGAGEGDWGEWVHGVDLAVSHYVDADFTGGRANWVLGWRPDFDSPVSGTLILGATRVLSGELVPSLASERIGVAGAPGLPPEDGFWRAVVAAHAWYDVTPQFAVGIENDFYLGEEGEALILPQVGWRPIEHVRVQLGGGWYRLGDQDEALLAVRVDLFNPSPRRGR